MIAWRARSGSRSHGVSRAKPYWRQLGERDPAVRAGVLLAHQPLFRLQIGDCRLQIRVGAHVARLLISLSPCLLVSLSALDADQHHALAHAQRLLDAVGQPGDERVPLALLALLRLPAWGLGLE